jgi:uncharacterized protein YjbI with pentapeptide repeats
MESRRLEALARFLAQQVDRREGVSGALALALAALFADVAAAKTGSGKTRKKRNKKRKQRKKRRGGSGLRKCGDIRPEAGADLHACDLRGANLEDADLTNARLEDADLSEANLAGATLSGARLWRTNLTGANLTNANFSPSGQGMTDIFATDFTGADMTDARFRPEEVYYAPYAIFCNTAGVANNGDCAEPEPSDPGDG